MAGSPAEPPAGATGPTWVDSHCHVHDARIPDGTEAAIRAAHADGVTAMITVGCDRDTSLAAIAAANGHPNVHPTVGLHPHDAVNGVDTIIDLLDTPGIVAVGEAGLDFFYDHSPREVQRGAFETQIGLAHDRDLPLIIHSRDAWDDTFDALGAIGTPRRTIFHCFTGGPDEAERALALGAHLSFSGIVTFKGAPEVQAAAQLCPLERMMIETDSPYLAPTPHRGQPNRPAWVGHVGRFIADLRDVPVEVIAAATSATAIDVFDLASR